MTNDIPNCEGPDPNPLTPKFTVPVGTCDTHFHIFGPSGRFAYGPNRKYTPPDSPLEDYFVLMEALGIERGVVVHPNLHGPDNAVTLDAIARSDGRFLGIVKLEASGTFEELKHLHTLGVRGVRFAFNPQHGGTFDAEHFDRTSGWCAELGWQIELHSAPDDLIGLADRLARADIPIVIDHLGRVDVSLGLDQEPFRVLLDLAREDHIWVKLTGADRITKAGPSLRRRRAVRPRPDRCGAGPHGLGYRLATLGLLRPRQDAQRWRADEPAAGVRSRGRRTQQDSGRQRSAPVRIFLSGPYRGAHDGYRYSKD